jgi:hypothetical protein
MSLSLNFIHDDGNTNFIHTPLSLDVVHSPAVSATNTQRVSYCSLVSYSLKYKSTVPRNLGSKIEFCCDFYL